MAIFRRTCVAVARMARQTYLRETAPPCSPLVRGAPIRAAPGLPNIIAKLRSQCCAARLPSQRDNLSVTTAQCLRRPGRPACLVSCPSQELTIRVGRPILAASRLSGRLKPGGKRACRVCWACPAAWKCKSSTQPDGGEGLAIRNGVVREAGSERSVEQKRESMNKNRI